jgi:hypothetical protein
VYALVNYYEWVFDCVNYNCRYVLVCDCVAATCANQANPACPREAGANCAILMHSICCPNNHSRLPNLHHKQRDCLRSLLHLLQRLLPLWVHWGEFKGLHGLHQHKLKKTVVHKQHSHSICKAHQYPRLMVGNIRQLKTATLPTALPLRQRNSRACTRGATTKPPPLSPGTPQTSWRGPFNQELVLSVHFRLNKHKRYLPVLPLFKYTNIKHHVDESKQSLCY